MEAYPLYFSTSTSGLEISLGRENLQGTNPNEVSRTVAEIILHPNYDSSSSDNDIALLRLSSPVKFTDYIRPVCLAASDSVFNNGTDSWVTGWGAVQEGGESARFYKVFCQCCFNSCWFHNSCLFLLDSQWHYRSLQPYKKWRFQSWGTDSVTVLMEWVLSQRT